MKELVVVSGKGGAGKTSITASLATLANNKIIVDCDVDASDMHLLLKPEIDKKFDFYGGKKAYIDLERCRMCGICMTLCAFDAIDDNFVVDELKCEGCGVCQAFCSANAITMKDNLAGEWYESSTRMGKLVHAKLGIGEDNSGKLVTKIRAYAKELASKNGEELIMIDGSPGIGCPVIASVTGANLVLIVTEPTLSGLHDLKRVHTLTKHFNIECLVCINKCDVNNDVKGQIRKFCFENGIDVVGEIPYSNEFSKAIIAEKTFIEHSKNDIYEIIVNMWNTIQEKLVKKEI